MTRRYAALLRGINVGRANRVPMQSLRDLLGSLGLSDVRTLLNSGNAVFSGPEAASPVLGARIERALSEELGISARVAVLSAPEMRQAIDDNPLVPLAADASRLIAVFPLEPADVSAARPLLERSWAPETLAIGTRAVYAWCPDGVTGSAVLPAIDRALASRSTARNWATVLRVAEAMVVAE